MNKKKKIFNKHFIGTIAIFVLIIVTVLTFISFIEDIIQQQKKEKLVNTSITNR